MPLRDRLTPTQGLLRGRATLLRMWGILWVCPWLVFAYQVWGSRSPHVVRVLVSVGALLLLDLLFLFGVLLVRASRDIRTPIFFALFAVTFASLVGVFAAADLSASRSAVGCFQDGATGVTPLSPISAIYYALTTLSTTGFGDVVARSDPCRTLSIVQLSLGFPAVALGIAGTAARVFRDMQT